MGGAGEDAGDNPPHSSCTSKLFFSSGETFLVLIPCIINLSLLIPVFPELTSSLVTQNLILVLIYNEMS